MRLLIFTIVLFLPFVADAQSKKDKKLYAALIISADSSFAAKNYSFAKEKYSKASGIKPKEQYPKDKITECDKLAVTQNAEYKKLIIRGDSAFEKKDWATAKSFYLQAVSVKPSEQYAADQAKNCNYQITAKNAMEERYKETIRKADSCLAIKSWSCARANYVAASEMKPSEQYPKDQIRKCDKNIVVVVDKERYEISIADADRQFDAGNFIAAKRLYTEALTFNPDSKYAKNRIAQCEEKINAPK